eukprot:4006309-Pleurochrysis_carterae.AAC.5
MKHGYALELVGHSIHPVCTPEYHKHHLGAPLEHHGVHIASNCKCHRSVAILTTPPRAGTGRSYPVLERAEVDVIDHGRDEAAGVFADARKKRRQPAFVRLDVRVEKD